MIQGERRMSIGVSSRKAREEWYTFGIGTIMCNRKGTLLRCMKGMFIDHFGKHTFV